MRSDVLYDSDFVEHDDLRQESERLQPEGERPGQLPSGPPGLNQAREDQSHREQHFQVGEVVAHRVVRRAVWFLEPHEVYDEGSRRDEEHFHEGVVQGDVVHEKVHVSQAENDQVNLLGLAGETDAVP